MAFLETAEGAIVSLLSRLFQSIILKHMDASSNSDEQI